MKTVRDVMTADVIRLSPTNKIKTAIILMKGHNIGGLPVVEDDQVVGVLDYLDILGKDNDIPVENIMDREFVTIPAEMPVADAADLMSKIGSGRLLVMDKGTLAGVVTRSDLLPEMGKSFDPITGLPRADALRDWGIAALRRGREVTVIFVDLDQFGKFNKKYGHITGDKVLQHIATILRSCVDDDIELLCRYAGDEFAIVSLRNSEEAARLVEEISERIRVTENPELPEPVYASLGFRGGKRTKERERVHYEATFDNLINLASKACIAAKEQSPAAVLPDGAGAAVEEAPETGEETAPAPQAATVPQSLLPDAHRRLNIQGLNLSWDGGSTATAEVELSSGERASRQSRAGFALGNSALRLVAEAAAAAITDFFPGPGYGIVAESVNVVQSGVGQDIVLVTALVVTPQNQIRACGSCLVKQDMYRAVVAALLNAVNRQVSGLI